MFHRSSFRLAPTIRQLLSSSSEGSVTVNGWVKSVRRQKNVSFAVISDGSSARGLQVVFGNGDLAKQLTNGASVRLRGKLADSPGKGQEKELLVEDVEVLGTCNPETYPIQKKALTAEYLREHAHLRARTDTIAAMIRLRHHLVKGIHHFFEDQGFCHTHTPILTANDAEGAGEAFKISGGAAVAAASQSSLPPEFFSRPAYLTVSHQLHLEALHAALGRVYTVGPCFRAERSLTGRHLAEFWMLEAEWGLHATHDTPRSIPGIDQVCDLIETCLRDIVGEAFVGGKGGEDMEVLWKGADERKRRVLEDAFSSSTQWERLTYTRAIAELQHASLSVSSPVQFQYTPKWGLPLQSEHERWLAETLVGTPVFITDYPIATKPFYMRTNDTAEGETVACCDLLVPHVGELAGGSVREERVNILERRMLAELRAAPAPASGVVDEVSVDPEPESKKYEWYLDLRRYGGVPHAGFGMGFERLVGWVGGIDNVRECIPMPRWNGRMVL